MKDFAKTFMLNFLEFTYSNKILLLDIQQFLNVIYDLLLFYLLLQINK